jgi:hypothetical protein
MACGCRRLMQDSTSVWMTCVGSPHHAQGSPARRSMTSKPGQLQGGTSTQIASHKVLRRALYCRHSGRIAMRAHIGFDEG